MDADLLLAIELQQQFDSELAASLPSAGPDARKRHGTASDVVPHWKPERPLSIVDESWETLDPSPDVRSMFLEFNDTFFWGKLSGVEVKWSARMTLCAGVCSYEGRGGLCSIRLSEPLLKLRPRKDLVETLLHEMIHALLFVTQNNRDRDGHGPEFCKHMKRINAASGTNISVYHDFHDEVDVYRQHWWRCDGPCQTRKPYFGYVKRAMNRAPSRLDPWWGDHQRTCGGTYTKVKEPEGYGKKGKKGGRKEEKMAGSQKPSSSSAAGSGSQDIRKIIPFSGKGFLLGGESSSSQVPVTGSPALPLPPSPPKPSASLKPLSSTGLEAPKKRSVGNTRAFVNIDGSPVRIQRPGNGRQAADRTRPKSLEDLFSRKPAASPALPKTSIQPPPLSGSSRDRTAAAGGPPPRKRPRDAADSAGIFHFFQKTLSSQAAASAAQGTSGTSGTSTPPPPVPQHTEPAAVPRVTVPCPVCQQMILESSINQHLDSCLSQQCF
ncbi:DNA-dependent metalloprotease SPRTN [Synchiropus picturatus]